MDDYYPILSYSYCTSLSGGRMTIWRIYANTSSTSERPQMLKIATFLPLRRFNILYTGAWSGTPDTRKEIVKLRALNQIQMLSSSPLPAFWAPPSAASPCAAR